jgi:hypothetical protein
MENVNQAGAGMAPKVSPADVEAEIVSEFYFTAQQGARHAVLDAVADGKLPTSALMAPLTVELGRLTFCVLVLRNGFLVSGESSCASLENFNEEMGRKLAREKAVDKVWGLLGYALREAIHTGQFGGVGHA